MLPRKPKKMRKGKLRRKMKDVMTPKQPKEKKDRKSRYQKTVDKQAELKPKTRGKWVPTKKREAERKRAKAAQGGVRISNDMTLKVGSKAKRARRKISDLEDRKERIIRRKRK